MRLEINSFHVRQPQEAWQRSSAIRSLSRTATVQWYQPPLMRGLHKPAAIPINGWCLWPLSTASGCECV